MLQTDGTAHYEGHANAQATRDFLKQHPLQPNKATLYLGPGLSALEQQGELPPSLAQQMIENNRKLYVADFAAVVRDDVSNTAGNVQLPLTVLSFDASDGMSAALHDAWRNAQDEAGERPDHDVLRTFLNQDRWLQTIISHRDQLRKQMNATVSWDDLDQIQVPVDTMIMHHSLDGMGAVTERDMRHIITQFSEQERLPILQCLHERITEFNMQVTRELLRALLQRFSQAKLLATFARDTTYDAFPSQSLPRMNVSTLQEECAAFGVQIEVLPDLAAMRHGEGDFPHGHQISRIVASAAL